MTQLLIVRHAIAEDRESFARRSAADRLRPLSEEGKDKMRQAARGLARLVPAVDLLATSPLVRARETAEILAQAFSGVPLVTAEALAPGAGPEAVAAWLESRRPFLTAAVVGHEPDHGELASWFLGWRSGGGVAFKKGGAALLEVASAFERGGGALLWLATPRMLRDLE
jgi:phosphohistidine phosphatase